MTKTLAAVARSWSKNNGKQLSSECSWQQRSRPCPLMWLLAVSLAASSLLVYTTAATQNPNKTQTSNYVRLTLSAYRGSETEKKWWPQRPTSLVCNSIQYDDRTLVLSVVGSLWIYCTTADKPRGVCRDWTVYFMGEDKGCMENDSSQLQEICNILNQNTCIFVHNEPQLTEEAITGYKVCDSIEHRWPREKKKYFLFQIHHHDAKKVCSTPGSKQIPNFLQTNLKIPVKVQRPNRA